MSRDEDLQQLVARAGTGDGAAFGALVRATQTDVWRLCSYLVDPATAEDLSQETYLRVLRALPGYAGTAPVGIWMLAIARRVCADELRSRVRRRRLLLRLDVPGGQPDRAGEIELAMLVAGLELGRREAFVLTQLVGLTYEEAAATVGCPIGTIRSRVARARTELAEALSARRDIADPASA